MRPGSLHARVTASIGRAILRGEVPAGSVLPVEDALAAAHGVSRAVIREAMKSLAAKGMVSVRPSAGTRVLPRGRWQLLDPDVLDWLSASPPEPDFVTELLELRLMIEPQAARLAARRATAADVAAMRSALARMEAMLDEGGDYVSADISFHEALLEAAHNRFLNQLGGAMARLLRFSTNLSWRFPDAARGSLPVHGALLEAVARGDGEAAASHVLHLIERHERHLRGMLGARDHTARDSAGEEKEREDPWRQ
ncbi:FadR/GntR family transcriptional regulator [Roseomonas chloroacetimidivorans]|uniref:FadR/GntR family transcriptional regulator n=1 Tax=Roseomonas chloroacetimidivorans TaxID=1766656 RepID=UPI003C7499F7